MAETEYAVSSGPGLLSRATARFRRLFAPHLVFYSGLLIALILLLLCGIVLYEGRIDARESARTTLQNLH